MTGANLLWFAAGLFTGGILLALLVGLMYMAGDQDMHDEHEDHHV